MAVVYVTSLYEGAGKTAFCAGLAHLLRRRGQRPTLFKPIRIKESAVPGGFDADAAFFARLQDEPPPDGWPVDVDAQESLRPQVRQRIMAAFQSVAGKGDEIIVEGPSMTTAQGEPLAITLELSEALDAGAVLLVRYSPNVPAQDVMAQAKPLGQRLLGVVVNGVPRYRTHTAQSSLATPLLEQGVPVLGILPEERCLLGVTVGQLVQHLDGQFLIGEDKEDQLVDQLMIGGLVLEWGVHYFGQSETKAVIARGDRPDIQMAALHTPTQCLVLTGGHHPIQHVRYKAEEEGIPLVLVQSDTVTTAKALETLFEGVTAHHPAKVECFAQSLGRVMDLEAIVAPAGSV